MFLDSSRRCFDCCEKTITKAGISSFIKCNRLDEFMTRFGMEDRLLHERPERISENTFSAAIPLTDPVLSSWKRRSTSKSQSFSTSSAESVDASRLSSRHMTSRARSSGESARASFSISVTDSAILTSPYLRLACHSPSSAASRDIPVRESTSVPPDGAGYSTVRLRRRGRIRAWSSAVC